MSSTTGQGALRLRALGSVGFLVALCVVCALTLPEFGDLDNGKAILFNAAILALAAGGQTVVVLTGNLDLSVGSIMGLVAYVVYDLTGDHPWLSPWIVVIAIGLGLVLGVINGLLVTVLEIPSIVATLGTLAIYRGAVSYYADAREVTEGSMPGWVRSLASGIWLGLPSVVWIAALLLIALSAALSFLPWGRRVRAVGSNVEAARFFGISANRSVFGAYLVSGVVAALAGLLLGAQVGNINSQLANGFELQTLAAVVVGGVSIWGGSGTVPGAALGAITLATIANALVLLGVDDAYQQVIYGAAVVLAVGMDALVQRRLAAGTSRRRILEVTA